MKVRFLPLGFFPLALIVFSCLNFSRPDFGLAADAPAPPIENACATTPLPDPAAIAIPSGARPSDAIGIARSILSAEDGAGTRAETAAPGSVSDRCVAKRLAAVEQLARDRIAQSLLPVVPSAGGNPSVHYFLPTAGLFPWSMTHIQGIAAPDATVELRIIRNAVVITQLQTTGDSSGGYAFHLNGPCCDPSDPPPLATGDIVEVSAAGKTTQVVATPFSAWLDPYADRLEGQTVADRGLTVTAYIGQPMTADLCGSDSVERTAPVLADGSVTISLQGEIDIKNTAGFAACALDAAGNGPCFYGQAYHLGVWPVTADMMEVSCQTKPAAPYTLEIWRNGGLWVTQSSRATETGSCDFMIDSIQPGDVLRLVSPTPFEFTVQPFSADFDHNVDQAIGQTAPDAQVLAQFQQRGYRYLPGLYVTTMGSCGNASACGSGQADGAGRFRLMASFDVARGDYVYITAYDANGNWQQSPMINAPAIFTDPVKGWVKGYWRRATNSALSVRIVDSSDRIKASASATLDPIDNAFFKYFTEETIQPGDRVEVMEPNTTVGESMTVQPWNVRMDGAMKRLTGSSENGYVLGWRDEECALGYSLSDPPDHCLQSDMQGRFEVPFVDRPTAPLLNVNLRGRDGHYTEHWASPFHVRFNMDSFAFWVTTETPQAQVTSALRRGGITTPIYCHRANPGSYYCVASGSAAVINPPQQGDIVDITAGDGDAVSLTLPKFTLRGSNIPPGIWGQAPAHAEICSYIEEYLRYQISDGSYLTSRAEALAVETTAGASGDYFASYAGLMSTAIDSPSVQWPVKPDNSCADLGASFTAAEGHTFAFYKSRVLWPQADAFENDDTREQASVYTGRQHHTFDTENDADWVRFEVSVSAVEQNVTHYFETFRLARGSAHDMALYDARATYPLLEWRVSDTDAEPSAQAWQPDHAGTYYLRVQRAAALGELFCADVYDLRIRAGDWQRRYLPVTSW